MRTPKYSLVILFCRISRVSLYELKDHLISCFDLGCINKDIYDEGLNLIETAKVSINGYIKAKNE